MVSPERESFFLAGFLHLIPETDNDEGPAVVPGSSLVNSGTWGVDENIRSAVDPGEAMGRKVLWVTHISGFWTLAVY